MSTARPCAFLNPAGKNSTLKCEYFMRSDWIISCWVNGSSELIIANFVAKQIKTRNVIAESNKEKGRV